LHCALRLSDEGWCQGKLYVWGRVGGAETVLAAPSPTLVPAAEALTCVAAGTHFVVAAGGRRVFTFGSNAEWGLGAGKDKKAVHRSCEPVLEAPSDVALLQTFVQSRVPLALFADTSQVCGDYYYDARCSLTSLR
jgi:hypothetical protein